MRWRKRQRRIAVADEEDAVETNEADAEVDNEYVFIKADQPVWQNLGER